MAVELSSAEFIAIMMKNNEQWYPNRVFQRRPIAWANLAKLTDGRLWPLDTAPQSTNTRYRLAYWHRDQDAASPLAIDQPMFRSQYVLNE